jgi:tRNA-dihydrouridine synthase C
VESVFSLRGLPFRGPWLLAPMEGVTEPCFRDLVLELHEALPHSGLGGAYTEIVREIDSALPVRVLRRHLGPRPSPIPVGLQLMGSDLAALSETAVRAVEAGAPLVDLNFGCPAKGALRGCAGSAVLRDPTRLETIVAAVARAVGDAAPVTAKIRAGYDDALRVEELARAAEAGGARMLTVHCRTRAEGYSEAVDWSRIARAVAAVSIPVCGNGGVERHADLARLRERTGCALVMVGRGALADPWIFAGVEVDARRAARFLCDYATALCAQGGATQAQCAARLKQLLRFWTAGGLCTDDRGRWLAERDPRALLERLAARAGRAWTGALPEPILVRP